MKVIVAKPDLKMFDGEDYIHPTEGDVIELPEDIAQEEIRAGFVTQFEGDEETSAKPKKKKSKKKAKRVVEEDDDEDEDDE